MERLLTPLKLKKQNTVSMLYVVLQILALNAYVWLSRICKLKGLYIKVFNTFISV